MFVTLGQGVFVFQMATASVAVGKLRLCFIFVGANLLACHFSFGSELVCYWRRSVCWWVLWSLGLRLFCGHASVLLAALLRSFCARSESMGRWSGSWRCLFFLSVNGCGMVAPLFREYYESQGARMSKVSSLGPIFEPHQSCGGTVFFSPALTRNKAVRGAHAR